MQQVLYAAQQTQTRVTIRLILFDKIAQLFDVMEFSGTLKRNWDTIVSIEVLLVLFAKIADNANKKEQPKIGTFFAAHNIK